MATCHDHRPLHRCGGHHGFRETLCRVAKQGLSQISGVRLLRVIRRIVLSLSRQCISASIRDGFCRKHLGSAAVAPSSISSSSWSVSILASSASQGLETKPEIFTHRLGSHLPFPPGDCSRKIVAPDSRYWRMGRELPEWNRTRGTLRVWNQLTCQPCIFFAERLPRANPHWRSALRRAPRLYSSAKITGHRIFMLMT